MLEETPEDILGDLDIPINYIEEEEKCQKEVDFQGEQTLEE